ncbi:MAG: site-2 protease family protein [Treponema sp.]|nr:site-2 protease family protein [Treponema sp.]MCL2273023.1 site-2 protease family protein [Treponema sp.]
MLNTDWQTILLLLPGILLGLTVHEFCHAFCAWKLGDNTAYEQGRLTLNPIKHIDIIGFIFIVVAGFGWAKPVQFNPENLRNLRRDKALIAAAGPLSNFILGAILALFVKAVLFYYSNNEASPGVLIEHLFYILYYAASINFGLFIFNLLPIPPLDGSHIVFSGLNLKLETEEKIRRIGMPVLFIILIVQNYFNITIIPIGIVIQKLMGLFI